MATSTGTSSTATTTAISTVTFASIMSAIDASVSGQVESALARTLGDHSRTASSPSHSAATTSSVITTPSSSAALAGMSFPCIYSCCALFSIVHITFSFWCTILIPAIFTFKKGANFSSAAGLCFPPPFLNSHVLRTLTANAEQAPASHSCSHSRPRHQRFQSPTLGSLAKTQVSPPSTLCCICYMLLSYYFSFNNHLYFY